MATCPPLIDADFVAMVTGADVSDTERVLGLIQVVSDMINDMLPGGCLDPETCPAGVKVICAEFVADALAGDQASNLRAEQVGDYRVEFQSNPTKMSIDPDALSRALRRYRPGGGATTVKTVDTEPPAAVPVVAL